MPPLAFPLIGKPPLTDIIPPLIGNPLLKGKPPLSEIPPLKDTVPT